MNQSSKILKPDLGVLERVGWLSEQSDELRQWFLRNGRWKTYSKGEVIYQQGDAPDCLYGLGQGAVDLTLPLVGEEPVTVYRAELGFWIGENAILAKSKRVIGVAAATDSRVFVVTGEALRELLAAKPQFWAAFSALSLRNAAAAVIALAEALSLSPRARLARTILRLAGERTSIEANQFDLARLIGMNRSSLRRATASLEDSKAVKQEYGSIVITDRAFLEAVANEP